MPSPIELIPGMFRMAGAPVDDWPNADWGALLRLPGFSARLPSSLSLDGLTLPVAAWGSGGPLINWTAVDWGSAEWGRLIEIPDVTNEALWGTANWSMPSIEWHGVTLPVDSWSAEGVPTIDWGHVAWHTLRPSYRLPSFGASFGELVELGNCA